MVSRIYVCESFSRYRGPEKIASSSLYQCSNCPVNNLNKDGKEMLYSSSNISRNNLRKHSEVFLFFLLIFVDIVFDT